MKFVQWKSPRKEGELIKGIYSTSFILHLLWARNRGDSQDKTVSKADMVPTK